MNFQEKVNNLLWRIQRNIHNYSEEDKLLIEKIPELQVAFLKSLSKKPKIDIDSIYDILNSVISDVDSSKFTKEEWENICTFFVESFMKKGEYSANLAYLAASELGLSDEWAARFQVTVDEYLRDPNNKFEGVYIDADIVEELLNYKRYDIILNISKKKSPYIYLTPELYERIKKECPYTTYPDILKDYEKKNFIYNYSLDDSIIELLEDYRTYCKNLKSELNNEDKNLEKIEKLKKTIDRIKKVIFGKLLLEPDLSCLNNNFLLVNTIISNDIFFFNDDVPPLFEGENLKKMMKILFEKNCTDVAKRLLSDHVITKEEIQEKIKYLLEHNLPVSTNSLAVSEIGVLDNEELVKNLIVNGQLNYLTEGYNRKALEPYLPFIYETVKNSDKYIELFETSLLNLTNYPDIFKELVENRKIKVVPLDRIGIDQESLNTLYSVIRNNPKVGINDGLGHGDKDFITPLINNGFLDITITSYILFNDFGKYKNLVLPLLKENLNSAYSCVRYGFSFIKEDKEVMNELLGLPIVTEKILETINHDETLQNMYNHYLFTHIKVYYAKKYGLDLSHLEQMEEQFGPRIIRYIDNEGLKELINLNDDEFQKLLGLFPNLTYDKTTLEAAHESLIQTLFVVNNNEKISIFPNFIHAVDDHNAEVINSLKEELILNTKTEFLITIIQKYNLKNIEDTKSLLDLIISKMTSVERDKYLNILHEITDEYISNARNHFRNNYYFEKNHPEYSSLCQKILQTLDEEGPNALDTLIPTIAARLDSKFFEQFNKDKELPPEYQNPQVLVSKVFTKLCDPNKRAKYLPFLKEIIDYYYLSIREEYSKEISLEVQLNLPYTFEEKNMRTEITKYIICNCEQYYTQDRKCIKDLIISELQDKNIPTSLSFDILNFYRGNTFGLVHSIPDIQKNIGIFVKTATKIINSGKITNKYGNEIDVADIIQTLDQEEKLKRVYQAPAPTTDIFQTLLNLNIDLLRENIFSNEEMYKLLLDIMKKKKLHLIPDNLTELIRECHISDDLTNVASFINFFVPILESERKRLSSLGKNPDEALSGLAMILRQAETYSSLSSVYSQVLGEKDAKLIKANPGPNSANKKLENNGRLKEAIALTVANYQRQEVTVPPFDETFTLPNGKSLNVIVGNFTDPSNLTHGERTGACMRIGGVGETLFNFCLNNPNGFHIRFEDPETHEYISRVSGFRNGNTVFLNELRYSCNAEKYEDLDVVAACRIAAKQLIELSQNSSCPIENVVIANQYAMLSSKEQIVSFNITDNKKGLPKFYSDVGNNGIVLATTAIDEPLARINFDKSNVPVYQPVRSKVLRMTGCGELVNRINRVASINALLHGANYEEIDSLQFEEGLVYGIVADDWYIYIDSNLSIHYDYLTVDPRAKEEFERHMVIIEEMIRNKDIKRDDVYVL